MSGGRHCVVMTATALVMGSLLLTGAEEQTAAAERPAAATGLRLQAQQRIVARFPLKPVRRRTIGQPAVRGTVVITKRGRGNQLAVRATLRPTSRGSAYEVWLYNSRTDARSLGAQVADRQGTLVGAGPLPSNYRRYRYVDISHERIDRFRSHSGRSVLRGRLR